MDVNNIREGKERAEKLKAEEIFFVPPEKYEPVSNAGCPIARAIESEEETIFHVYLYVCAWELTKRRELMSVYRRDDPGLPKSCVQSDQPDRA